MERTSAYFRCLNERIVQAAEDIDFDGFVPLVCECADSRCFRLVRTTLPEFDALRARPGGLVLYPGHDADGGRVLVANDRHTIVELDD